MSDNEQYKEYRNIIEELKSDNRVVKVISDNNIKGENEVLNFYDKDNKINKIVEVKKGDKWTVTITYERYVNKHNKDIFNYYKCNDELNCEVKVDKIGDKYFEELNRNVKIIEGVEGYFYRYWEAHYEFDEPKVVKDSILKKIKKFLF